MSQSDAAVPAQVKSPKKTKISKQKKPKSPTAPSHPPIGAMVKVAIVALKERKGSSLHAIKKHIYTVQLKGKPVNEKTINYHIRRALKVALEKKTLVQIKGSYKLSPEKKEKQAKVPKKPAKKAKKPAGVKKTAKKATKKPATKKRSPKKHAVKKQKPVKKAVKKPAPKKKVAKKQAKNKK